MISTVIFDLDGLLADSEKLHRQAYQDVLGKQGITVTNGEYEDHWIRAGKGIDDFARDRDLDLNIDSVRGDKAERYRQLVQETLQPMPGALSLLEKLVGKKTCALASASYRDSVDWVLGKLSIADYFAVIATQADVERLKPFPDIFLYTAENLNVKPSSCVVIEDAEKGVIAASEAGMKCIAVPNEHTRNNDFSRATIVVSSLEDVTLELFDSRL